jgi:hypothetical protein
MADTDNGWWREFVAQLPARTAKLAVVRKDGTVPMPRVPRGARPLGPGAFACRI